MHNCCAKVGLNVRPKVLRSQSESEQIIKVEEMKSSSTSRDPEIQLKGIKKFIIHFNIK